MAGTTSLCRFFIAFSFSVLGMQCSYAQHPKAASCQDSAFDRKVDSYLSYSVPVISVADAFAKKEKVRFLDAREKKEFDVSHIAHAEWVGYEEFTLQRVQHLPRNTPIVVYCSIGYRSEKIGEKLLKAGFTNVKNLYGSLFEWVNAGYGVVNSQGHTVASIHTYDAAWSRWVLAKNVRKTY